MIIALPISVDEVLQIAIVLRVHYWKIEQR